MVNRADWVVRNVETYGQNRIVAHVIFDYLDANNDLVINAEDVREILMWADVNREISKHSGFVGGDGDDDSDIVGLFPTPNLAFRHLLPNSAKNSYATEGALFIFGQLSTDAVSALLQTVWLLTRL